METFEKAAALIAEQQKALDKESAAWMVGEQLREIIRGDEAAAAIAAKDLEQSGMGLADCEKQIKAWADSHKKGNCVCVTPKTAERIIRQFYGLPDRDEGAGDAPAPAGPGSGTDGLLDIADFL